MENIQELFIKYLTNTCNKEELNRFIDWVKNPDNTESLKKLITQDWDSLSSSPSGFKPSAKSFEALMQKIREEENEEKHQTLNNHLKVNKFARRNLLKIAASLTFLIFFGAGAFLLGGKFIFNQEAAYNTVTAPMGSKTKLVLSDGSVIWLNAGSTLEYPSVFSENTRTVRLSGEGYFEIAKNKKAPFIVKTSEIDIKVLGTKFNLKSYPDEGSIETTLIEGKVSILKTGKNNPGKPVELKPNEKATFIKKDGRILQGTIEGYSEKEKKTDSSLVKERKEQFILSDIKDTEPYTAWKDERLVFSNENFEEVCILMERWYNVQINLHAEELKNYHYTGILENENIIDAIKAFQMTVPFSYNINHDIIDIWPEKNKEHLIKN